MKKTTYVVISCILLLLAGGLYYFLKDVPLPSPQPPQQAETGPKVVASFNGNTITEENAGKKVWDISADSIEMTQDGNTAVMKNIKAVFYKQDGGKVNLVAPQGTMDMKTKNMKLEGDIKATSTDGDTFTVRQIQYIAKERHFYGTGNVRWTRGDLVMTGDTIDSDADMQKIRVKGHALVRKGGESN
ncbi:lptc yrbk: lps export abc transporter periplasmic protein lptc [Lucifera butyrica]|uniref:Lptc yrbk: lps export abc transporter periplasmic protein lptc n=1 Tax=Lucifera butyrica TaxID=1351585 RepID=A0A498RCW4_9FIRM|nr:LPS export ABC transporter periplasmic protein LptC [Lucifera butyrica]VBB09281.1 lptc yrbk: lps export abc transporter periplasmic protein lptc [Lucifera butyrica]